MINRSTSGVEPLPTDDASTAGRRSGLMASFIHEQRPSLFAFMRSRVPSEEDAEEAAQDCFERLLRYQDDKAPFTWRFLLYRIAANVATDRARRAKSHHRTDHVPLDDLAVASAEPSQEERLASEQELALLRAAILALPPKCKQVFLLHRVHGLTYAQIAKRCGISVKMVEKHIHKAVTLCQARVERGR